MRRLQGPTLRYGYGYSQFPVPLPPAEPDYDWITSPAEESDEHAEEAYENTEEPDAYVDVEEPDVSAEEPGVAADERDGAAEEPEEAAQEAEAPAPLADQEHGDYGLVPLPVDANPSSDGGRRPVWYESVAHGGYQGTLGHGYESWQVQVCQRMLCYTCCATHTT